MSPRTAIATLATAALLAVGFSAADVDARRRDHRVGYWQTRAEMYEAAYAELSDGLDKVDRLNEGRHTRRTKRKIRRVVDRARERALGLLAVDEVVVVEPAEPEAMNRTDFAQLRKSIADASFARERLRLVESAAEHNFFTVSQVVVLVRLADFETTKIEMATTLYPRVLEVKDWYRVYDALTFESSKKKLRKRVRKLSRNDY